MSMMDGTPIASRLAGVGGLAKLSPDTVRGYVALSSSAQKTGCLDAKTRELISAAVAITLRRDDCITVHVEAARKLVRRGRSWPERSASQSASTLVRPSSTASAPSPLEQMQRSTSGKGCRTSSPPASAVATLQTEYWKQLAPS